MNQILENLNINRVVLHQIFKRNEDKTIKEPFYNRELTKMDATAMFTFNQRVIQAIGSDSHSLEMDIYKNDEMSLFGNISKLISANDYEFVEISKKVAYKLAEAQTSKRIPGGTIVIFDGTVGSNNNKFIGVMKAEYQEGFQLSTDKEKISLEFIQNLILTPQQKLYKIGMFIRKSSNISINVSDYISFVYDSNLGKNSRSDAAQYFYDSFLGCKFKANNNILTKEFYNQTTSFINSLSNISENEKVELNYALYTYARVDQSPVISTRDFADKYVKSEIKDDYINYMQDNKFPQNSICKDLSLISNSLANRRINFPNNVRLVAPSDKFKDSIIVGEIEDGYINIKIKGTILSQE